MSEFRFRALAALELRRQEETAAGTALALAEAAFRAAEARTAAAEADRRLAQQQQMEAERTGSDAATLFWHRNWIVRLAAAIDARKREADARVIEVRRAEQSWRDARQRRLALERMRERGMRRFQQEQQRQELKVIDELARLRFVMPDVWRGDS